MSAEERRLALLCPACYFVRGALISRDRAELYRGIPNLQAPILKGARLFAAMAVGKECSCGLNLTYEE